MPEFLPRILVVLTGLVAVIALYVGITDYLHRRKDAAPPSSESASTVVPSSAATVRKKIAKSRQARTLATESIDAVPVPAQGDDTGTGKQIVGEAFGAVLYDAPKAHQVQPAFDRFDGTLTSAACVPLPNSTKPGDVDATYYQNWAKEYGCKLD